jgi:hypothetical protein
MRSWLPPFRVELTADGSRWGDAAFFGPQFLLSDRATRAATTAGLTGLGGLEMVEIVKASGASDPLPLYRRVALSPGTAAVDDATSDVNWPDRDACDWCRGGNVASIRGFRLEADTADDLFLARDLPGVPIASERFKEVAERAGVTNVAFVPTDSYYWLPLG